jgi:hydroxyquinol 1,2-dioxygenase
VCGVLRLHRWACELWQLVSASTLLASSEYTASAMTGCVPGPMTTIPPDHGRLAAGMTAGLAGQLTQSHKEGNGGLMRNVDENTITSETLGRIANTPNPRLKLIMESLIRHLHDFARETQLTEEEWFAGIQFLTDAGNITDEKRQEFILLSDTLGLSMLIICQNNRKPRGCTEATVFGPFHVAGAPEYPLGADIANGALGEPCYVRASIKGLDGEPVANAKVEVWQADADGFYDIQYAENHAHRGRGVLHADEQGKVYFSSVLAEAYPIPTDGPVGRMLKATARHPWRPAHMHFMIEAPGYERLITHVFRDQDKYLDSDAVFGVRSSLITHWRHHEPGETPDGKISTTPFYTLDFGFVLNKSHAASSAPG